MTNVGTVPDDRDGQPTSEEDIEHMSRSIRLLPLAQQLETQEFSTEEQIKFEEAFRFFNTVPTIKDVKVHFFLKSR